MYNHREFVLGNPIIRNACVLRQIRKQAGASCRAYVEVVGWAEAGPHSPCFSSFFLSPSQACQVCSGHRWWVVFLVVGLSSELQ